MGYRGNRRQRGIGEILASAGLFLIIMIGMVLMALSLGFCLGAQVVQP